MARITRLYVSISLALIALVASLGIIAAKAPEPAYAAGGAAPTWTLVGTQIIDTGDGSYLSSYAPSSSSTSMHVDAGDGLGTWSFDVSWSAPPSKLAVGNEDDLLTSMIMSISSDKNRRGSVGVDITLDLGFLRAGTKGTGTGGISIDSQGAVDVSAAQWLENNYLGDPSGIDDSEILSSGFGCTMFVPQYRSESDFGKPYSRSHSFNPTLAYKTGTPYQWQYTQDIAKQGPNAVGGIWGMGDFVLVLTIDVSPGYEFRYIYACAVDGSNELIIDTDADKNPGESDGTTPGSTTPGGNGGGGSKPGKSGGNSGNDNGGTKKIGGWIIPVGIVLGGGTLILVGKNAKKKKQNQTPTPGGQPVAPANIQQSYPTNPQQPTQPLQPVQQPPYAPYSPQRRDDNSQQPSTFRMVLWKNIGDTIIDCGPTQLVGARIEEITPEGALIYRDDLTQRITFSVTDNIIAKDAGMQGKYRCIEVLSNKKTDVADEKGIVAITFNGEGGTYTNRVHFKVEKLALVFADVPLTFVAGARQTFLMPFKFSVEDIAKGVQPRFAAKLTSPRANEDFTGARVVIDPDFPDKLFSVALTECGPIAEDDVPGQMEYNTCEVTCVIPAKEGQGEINLTGRFEFFRFFEGLRFTCEPLKCYVEKYTEKDDLLISADDALTAAATLQSEAMGLAGAVNPAVLQPPVEKMLRESARKAKDMFPEIFSEENVYVLDKRNAVKVTPARTHAYVTLYVTDEFTDEKGNKYTRPVSVLPKWDQVILTFEDIPGTSVLYDKDGKPLSRPADICDFRYFIKDVKGTDNTVVFEILPTKGILLPPNRSKVKVTASVLWKDRAFKEEREVNAISQPYRKDFIENWEKYTLGAEGKKGDDEIRKILLRIQAVIQGRYNGKVAVEGRVNIDEVAKDVAYDYVEVGDEYVRLFNPVTGPGQALLALYKSIRGERTAYDDFADHVETARTSLQRSIERQSKDIYYDDLMPLYHYIQMMIDGYDEHFGFFEPDVQRVVITFARFQNGELGSAEAIDLAYTGHDIEFAECMKMIISDFAHSWTMVGLRIGFALFTAGKSEIFFIPFQALASGMEASLNYIDRGGDNMLEAYRIGIDRSLKVAFLDVAITVGIGLVGKCIKGAWVLTKEAWTSRQVFFQAVQEMYSTGKYAKQVVNAATNVGKQMSAAEAQAARITKEIMDASRGGLDVAADELNRDIANTLGRINGSYKVDAVMRMMDGVSALSAAQKRAVIMAVQTDKHAMRVLLQRTSEEAMAKSHAAVQLMEFFNANITQIENEVIENTIKRLQRMKEFAGKEIRAIRTSGNSAKKVGMDLDVTFKYIDETGALRDVKSAIGQKAFNAELYKLAKGALADEATMAKFARMADMTVTDLFHPESYSSDYQNVVRILNESRAGEAFTQAREVAKAVEYKCMHWLSWADDAAAAAGNLQKLHAAGVATEEQVKEMYKLAALSEALVEEGIRQYTKQAERIIIKKLAAMEAEHILVRSAVQMEAFFGKVALLKRCGFDLTPAQTEYALKTRFGCTLKEAFEELGVYTKDLSDSIQAVKGV